MQLFAVFSPLVSVLWRRSRTRQFWQFLANRAPPEEGPVFLSQRRIYILPTGHGYTFALALALMLIGSINYALSLGFVLTFLLAGMGVVSILHAFRNLAHLTVSAGRAAPTFAGQSACFTLHLDNPSRYARWSIVGRSGSAVAQCDIPARATGSLVLSLPATKRGWLWLGRVTLETRYPLGLLRAWSYVRPAMRVLVYPRPDEAPLPGTVDMPEVGEALAGATGSDDFAGLRPFQPSDSPRHVAWKSAARGSVLLTKVFSGRATRELMLDYDRLPAALDVEQRLSRLTRWVLAASAADLCYGLRLPGRELPLQSGGEHRDTCLEALALFNLPAA